VGTGVFELNGVLLLVKIAKDWAFLEIDLSFLQIGLSLNEIRVALFGVVSLFGALLVHLVGKVVEFSESFTGLADLLSVVELGDGIAGFDVRAIFGKAQQGELAAYALECGHLEQEGVERHSATGAADCVCGLRDG
jgi:hypothetical protein